MREPFVLKFSDSRSSQVISLEPEDDLISALRRIGLAPPRPLMVLVGGADGLALEDQARLQSFFANGIAAVAQARNLCVLDGGTDSGVMRLIAQAREEMGATFPLIGVCPIDRVAYADSDASTDHHALESRHSHFVLAPGSSWREGARWQARVATALAGDAESVTVLVNGGEVAWTDVSASIEQNRKVVVIEKSGRTADVLVEAFNGKATDERAQDLIASGLIETVDAIQNPALFVRTLEKIFP